MLCCPASWHAKAALCSHLHSVQSHERWTHSCPGWRSLAALLRLSSAAALAQLLPAALPALQGAAADHERDPRLRLELLQLVAALLADDSKAAAWPEPDAGQPLVAGVLLPALVWRAGRVPAAARLAALSAIAMLLARQRLPPAQLQQLAVGGAVAPAAAADGVGAAAGSSATGGLLAAVAGCLDEEYEPDNRQLACTALGLLLGAGAHRARWAGLLGWGPAAGCRAIRSCQHLGCSGFCLLAECTPCLLHPRLLQWGRPCRRSACPPCAPTSCAAWTTAATACGWRPAARCRPGWQRRRRRATQAAVCWQTLMLPAWLPPSSFTWTTLILRWQRRCALLSSSWRPCGQERCARWRRRRPRSRSGGRCWRAWWRPAGEPPCAGRHQLAAVRLLDACNGVTQVAPRLFQMEPARYTASDASAELRRVAAPPPVVSICGNANLAQPGACREGSEDVCVREMTDQKAVHSTGSA